MTERVAVVTGASRGLGAGVTQALADAGYTVLAGAREPRDVEATSGNGSIIPFAVDVGSDNCVAATRAAIAEHTDGRCDVLINNAGIVGGSWSVGVDAIDFGVVANTINVNAIGAARMAQAALPALTESAQAGREPRIVNVSSGMGQLSDMGRGVLDYRMSKTALNALTRVLHAEYGGDVFTASVCPGWVKTDMGSDDAPRSIAEGIDTIVWLATDAPFAESGNFWRDRARIDW